MLQSTDYIRPFSPVLLVVESIELGACLSGSMSKPPEIYAIGFMSGEFGGLNYPEHCHLARYELP